MSRSIWTASEPDRGGLGTEARPEGALGRRYFQAGSSRPVRLPPSLWMIRAHQGEESGEGTGTCAEGRDPAPSTTKADCGQLGPRLSTEQRGLFHCRPWTWKELLKASLPHPQVTTRLWCWFHPGPLQSQRPASALEPDSRPPEARPRSHLGSTVCSYTWRQRKEL